MLIGDSITLVQNEKVSEESESRISLEQARVVYMQRSREIPNETAHSHWILG